MDGATAQDRVYAGYAKAAAKLGLMYEVYRSDTPLYPADPGKLIATIPMAYARDKNFSVPNKYLNAAWLCYADGRLLRQGDILKGPDGTFYVGDMQHLLPLQIVKCSHTVRIGRVAYSTSGGIEAATDYYAEDVPAMFQFRREDIQKPTGGLGAAQLGRAITHWEVFLPLPQGVLRQDDVMVDEQGLQYTVDAPDWTAIGYVAQVRLATV